MDQVIELVMGIIENAPVYIASAVALLGALIAFFMLIPGENPEKFLQSILDFLTKFSKK